MADLTPSPASHPYSIALVANGIMHDHPEMRTIISAYDQIIAVDGGIKHCYHMGLKPSLVIGDLDSSPGEHLAYYSETKKMAFPKDKNESDLELAILMAIQLGATKIGIFGCTEGRTDHSLYTLHLLHRYPDLLVVENENERLFVLKGQQSISTYPGQTISLIPLGECKEVTTTGLKWELHKADFDHMFMSLSNVALSTLITVSISQGMAICCMQKN